MYEYELPYPRDITQFTEDAYHCPSISLYLKSKKNSSADLDLCINTITDRLKPRSFVSPLLDPVKAPAAIMLVSAVLVEAYNSKQLPEDIMLTLEQVPMGYPVQLKFNFHRTKTSQHLYVSNYALTKADLQTLMPRQWLSDQIVMAFLSLISKEFNRKNAYYSYVLPKFLALKWEVGDYGSWIFPKESLEKYDIILLLICHQDHWFLLAARPQMRTVSVLDSKMKSTRQNRFIHHWRMFMRGRHQTIKQAPLHWAGEEIQTSQQTDGDSCGVFVLMNSAALLHQKPTTIMRPCHVAMYRKYVKHMLFTNSTTRS